jgi:hypothetical protein
MKRFYLAAALAASALTATSASAAFDVPAGPANFSVVTGISGGGVPGSPATLSGIVDYSALINGASTTVTGFNVAINGTDYADFANGVTALFSTSDGSNGTLAFTSGASTIFAFNLSGLYSANNAGALPSGGMTVSTATSFNYGSGNNPITINAGSEGTLTFTSAAVAAVPEPATWGMMLLGFGMMGASMRYRRRETKVVYA